LKPLAINQIPKNTSNKPPGTTETRPAPATLRSSSKHPAAKIA